MLEILQSSYRNGYFLWEFYSISIALDPIFIPQWFCRRFANDLFKDCPHYPCNSSRAINYLHFFWACLCKSRGVFLQWSLMAGTSMSSLCASMLNEAGWKIQWFPDKDTNYMRLRYMKILVLSIRSWFDRIHKYLWVTRTFAAVWDMCWMCVYGFLDILRSISMDISQIRS